MPCQTLGNLEATPQGFRCYPMAMAYRREAFEVDGWYHCYSRGVDKRTVFESEHDYKRFQESLYISNDTAATNRQNYNYIDHAAIFELPKEERLVSVAAYCLMPTHFHLLLQEVRERGITRFMHKLGTSYTMYFNIRNERTGNLFVKPFRSRRVDVDNYFEYIPQYIHLNPVELYEKNWKRGVVPSFQKLERQLSGYQYSSLPEYIGQKRPESVIVDPAHQDLFSVHRLSLARMLREAAAYYAGLEP